MDAKRLHAPRSAAGPEAAPRRAEPVPPRARRPAADNGAAAAPAPARQCCPASPRRRPGMPSSPPAMRAPKPRAPSPAPRAAPRDHPPRTKVLACAALTLVQIFASSVLKLANSGGAYAFSPQASLVLSEAAKVALSAAYLAHGAPAPRRALREETHPRLLAHLFALAAIYAANNALMFWLFARADPGSITLIKSGATVVSAGLLYVWRRFRLSAARWLVVLTQLLGLVVAQYDVCTGRAHLPGLVYAALFISLFNSSVANVWNEHVVKSFEGASLATKNIHLYSFGVLLNLGLFLYNRATDPTTPAFFEGYSLPATLVVISNAFMGIAINLVYKYADALVKNISTTTTTVVLLILSAMFFGGRSNPMVFLGAAVVLLGTFLYFILGVQENNLAELRKQADRARSPSRTSDVKAFAS